MEDAFARSLPRRYVGAGLLLTDHLGRVLLVNPSYKPGWEIPGGLTEAGETPPACCARECLEELGSTVRIGRLLVIEHQHRDEPLGDSSTPHRPAQ